MSNYASIGGAIRQAGATAGTAAGTIPRYQSTFNPVGAASAGSGIIGSIVSGITTNKNVKRQIKAQMELAEKAYQRDLEMWNRANEYNTPAAQMQRFKEAGLNPHLIYGKGTPGNAAQSMPQYQTPDVDYTKRVSPIGEGLIAATPAISAYQNYKVANAQHDNLKALAGNIEARTTSELLKAAGYSKDNQLKGQAVRLGKETLEFQIARAELENDRINAVVALEEERLQLVQEQRGLVGKQKELADKQLEEVNYKLNLLKTGMDQAPWWIRAAYQNYGDVWKFGDDQRYPDLKNPKGINKNLKR